MNEPTRGESIVAKAFQILVLLWATMAAPLAIGAADRSELDAQAIEKAAGTEATTKTDGVVRIGWSRTDVPVTIDGLEFPPAAGLGSWAAFKALPSDGVMVMGDTVVFEDEITPAMDAAFAHGLEVTALHNHLGLRSLATRTARSWMVICHDSS